MMPTTRGAVKRAMEAQTAAASGSSKKATKEQGKAEEPHKTARLSEADRKHHSQEVKTGEIYERKDWDDVVRRVQVFKTNPGMGRLLIEYNYNLRKAAAKIPVSVVKKDLSPLTNLTRLCFGGEGLAMADSDPLPLGVQLPQLRVADLDAGKQSLETIASFMPNVEHLSAHIIQIHMQPVAYLSKAASASSSGDSHPASCKKVTHLGCDQLWVFKPSSIEATSAAIAAAFPQLRVLTHAPSVTGFPDDLTAPEFPRKGPIYIYPGERYHVHDYAKYLKKLTAIRLASSDAFWHPGDAKEMSAAACAARPDWGLRSLSSLDHLRVLWMPDMNAVDLRFACQVSQLTQLTEVCFSLCHGVITTGVQQLLQSLAELPNLATLAMPAHVLCNEGCATDVPTMSSTLNQVLALPSLKRLILLGIGDYCMWQEWDWGVSDTAPSRGGFSAAALATTSKGTQDCKHGLNWADAINRLVTAAAAAKSAGTGSGLQVLVVNCTSNRSLTSDAASSTDWGHPVWGVFGPEEGLFSVVEW